MILFMSTEAIRTAILEALPNGEPLTKADLDEIVEKSSVTHGSRLGYLHAKPLLEKLSHDEQTKVFQKLGVVLQLRNNHGDTVVYDADPGF